MFSYLLSPFEVFSLVKSTLLRNRTHFDDLTDGQLLAPLLEPSFCHTHFHELMFRYTFHMNMVSWYLRKPENLTLRMQIENEILYLEDGHRVGEYEWIMFKNIVNQPGRAILKKYTTDWVDFGIQCQGWCTDCHNLCGNAEGKLGTFKSMRARLFDALVDPSIVEHVDLFNRRFPDDFYGYVTGDPNLRDMLSYWMLVKDKYKSHRTIMKGVGDGLMNSVRTLGASAT